MTTATEGEQARGFFGHPRGLANLFGTEMWERFSYYGMQAILLYYLYFSVAEGGLAIDKATAAGIVGAYGGSVYLATIAGSWVADRLFGPERTLFYSGVLILLGHVALAVLPGVAGVAVGLICVAIGSGGLKATATTLVGALYEDGDERRDAGFSIFYMGINLGALVGPLLTGLLQTRWGFHWGFGLAAVGMAIGLAQYTLGRKNLPESGKVVPNPLDGLGKVRAFAVIGIGVAAVVVLVLTGVVNPDNLATIVTWVIATAAVALFAVLLLSKQVDRVERQRVLAFIPMFLVSFGFWSLFQQQFTVLAIYAEERVDLDLFGWQIPPSWFNSVEPLFVVLLAPVFAALWVRLGERQPPTPVKFALGVSFMGVAFLVMALLGFNQGEHVVPPLLLVLVLIIFVLGELCLSPVGLSLSTKLAPRAYTAQMVALFYLSLALGSSVAGALAEYYTADSEPAYFGILGAVAIGLGVVMAALTPFVRKLMNGVR
ncbi:peptide MFS transporter [Actinokineospora globicatena]|uniref:peptide MFS transporter n=1 Tax=Actinokineospora globicatena TaxID=103729 RepID=UPI0020A58CA3|nr:oligopeptide:H+ symporter [Actinokineospora globicatena]MCP2305422.1 proton-dependent oligopeptide transporter, POT family [Actinokineospora globicatena]GLW81288.1 MFS transporter [Actinokineospora globicatena]GLW88014.1 MFS transporter [Actinokineospora globicatena]